MQIGTVRCVNEELNEGKLNEIGFSNKNSNYDYHYDEVIVNQTDKKLY